MRVLVTGATGYIGGRLVPRLIERGYDVRCLARDARRLAGRFNGAQLFEGDVNDASTLAPALGGVECAYYLVHSMSETRKFVDADRDAARTFGKACAAAGPRRIIYLGGLGEDTASLSKHLQSRHEVGDVLRESGVAVTEFRAAQIVGSGSVSFEMVRYLTERLPVMVAPKWVMTKCQPIGIDDVLAYLTNALDRPQSSGQTYEIGGSDVLSYRDMMMMYARIRALKRRIVVVPVLTARLSSYWIHLVTPIPAKIAQPLILGLHNEVVVHDHNAARDFPEIVPMPLEEAIRLALSRYSAAGPETTWFDAFDVRKMSGEFMGVKEGMLIDRRTRKTAAPPERVAAVFSALGGKRGWLAGRALWELRGLLDRWSGGVGLRRGRRSPTELRVGDAVDFWRVDAYEPGHILRLRAEMRLPGSAWLEFEASPDGNGGTELKQTAFFEPRGLYGYLYWYSVAIFHEWIFSQMATRIVRVAENTAQ